MLWRQKTVVLSVAALLFLDLRVQRRGARSARSGAGSTGRSRRPAARWPRRGAGWLGGPGGMGMGWGMFGGGG